MHDNFQAYYQININLNSPGQAEQSTVLGVQLWVQNICECLK